MGRANRRSARRSQPGTDATRSGSETHAERVHRRLLGEPDAGGDQGFGGGVGRAGFEPIKKWDSFASRAVVLVGALVLLVGTVWLVLERISDGAGTTLALHGATGQAAIPRRATVGKPVEVGVTITNREAKHMTYRLSVAGAGTAVDPLPEIRLADGATWTAPVRIAIMAVGENLPVRIELRLASQDPVTKPYRELTFTVDVIDPYMVGPDGGTPEATTSDG